MQRDNFATLGAPCLNAIFGMAAPPPVAMAAATTTPPGPARPIRQR
jgi:hypothetical protein